MRIKVFEDKTIKKAGSFKKQKGKKELEIHLNP
jgi:hypothetical protein